MKTEIENQHTWDDVIFENRNRSYGAYLIRQTYSRNATIAFGASVSFAILLLFLPQIISALTGKELKIVPNIKIFDPPTRILPQPPVVADPPKVTPPPASSSTLAKNIPLQVVTTETDTEIPPNNELLINEPSTGDEGGVYVETPGTGTIEEVAPVIVPPSGPLDIAEVMPEYKGGAQAMIKFLSNNLRYPRSAYSVGVEGTVYVSFVINADGDVVDVKVIRGVSADCDKEAMRVVSKMSEWNAGMMHQIPVSVRMILPVKFTLNH